MRRSTTGLIGGIALTVMFAAALVIVSSLGSGNGSSAHVAVAGGQTTGGSGNPPVSIDSASGCIGVSARSGQDKSPGCVRAADVYAPPPAPQEGVAPVQNTTPLPVYADATATKQVGVLVSGNVGFVPTALEGRVPEISACMDDWGRQLGANPGSVNLSDSCHDLLVQLGYDDAFLAGGWAKGTGAGSASSSK